VEEITYSLIDVIRVIRALGGEAPIRLAMALDAARDWYTAYNIPKGARIVPNPLTIANLIKFAIGHLVDQSNQEEEERIAREFPSYEDVQVTYVEDRDKGLERDLRIAIAKFVRYYGASQDSSGRRSLKDSRDLANGYIAILKAEIGK
jgi:hypothetical protein